MGVLSSGTLAYPIKVWFKVSVRGTTLEIRERVKRALANVAFFLLFAVEMIQRQALINAQGRCFHSVMFVTEAFH